MVQRLWGAGVGISVIVGVLVAPAAAAQQRGAAMIAGVATDSSGAVMPGVTVEAASPALIEKVRAVVTDSKGQYKIVDLRPGTYTVTFSLPGFSTFKREGIELTPNFTANVVAELKVGGLEETVTVSGVNSLVDVQGVTQTNSISSKTLDVLPGTKGQLAFAAITPSVVSSSVGQDVGGSKGEFSVRMTVHGNKGGDAKLLIDGMRYNTMAAAGTGKGFFMNPAEAQEITVELGGGGSAEYDTGGVHVNMVPKDGGNRFSAYAFTAYANSSLQENNLDAELQARGLTTVNAVDKIYDTNLALGGPLRKDKAWFFTSYRHWGVSQRMADRYFAETPATPANGYAYLPDQSRPASNQERENASSLRVTWQVSPKNKITASADIQDSCSCTSNLAQTFIAMEASSMQVFAPSNLFQFTWTHPRSNKLLFEAGSTTLVAAVPSFPQAYVPPSSISILEQSTGFRYNSASTYALAGGGHNTGQWNQRFSVSYVTGSHNFKTGVFMLEGHPTNNSGANQDVNYAFLNRRPAQITEFATTTTEARLKDMGLYVQDQWTTNRLTVSGGLRFDYLNVSDDPTVQPTNRFFSSTRSFPGVDCVPCWKDLSPRMSAAYDVFGTGKTAVKASLGRYVASETTTYADALNPANTTVRSVTRQWTDTNNNFIPDCDLTNVNLNAECGRVSDLLFGQSKVTTTADPEVLNGWQHRAFNWQASVRIDQQLMTGVAVTGGYYRTWFGNFTVTDNLEVSPANYDPYCVTLPVDARLPGGGGNSVCGLYDLNPTKVGAVNNLITFASNYGKQTEVYNGGDVNLTARLPHGAQFSGGLNIGNSVNGGGISGASAGISHTNNCDVLPKIDNPSTLYCDASPPYQARLKMYGYYPLPLDFQVSGTFNTLPGVSMLNGNNITANIVVPNAQIAPSLGRSLSSGSSATIPLVQPFTQFEARLNQLDLRLSKILTRGRARIQANFDVYNATNANPVVVANWVYSGTGASYLVPTQILDGRLFKFSGQIEF